MAVVVTVFTSVPGQVWASGSTVAELQTTDPAYKVGEQLQNFIAAVNNPAWIRLHSSSDPIYYFSSECRWHLVLNEGESQAYGLQFMPRYRSAGATSYGYTYRVADFDTNVSTGAEGTDYYRSYTGAWNLTAAGIHFIAYESSGTTPWFVYAYKQNAESYNNFFALLSRLDVSGLVAGSYYPPSGLGKWMYHAYDTSSTPSSFTVPQARFVYPYYGIQYGGNMRLAIPGVTGYFHNMPAFYADVHFLGQPGRDILITNGNTGSWGDTVTIEGINYTCLKHSSSICWWVKSSN